MIASGAATWSERIADAALFVQLWFVALEAQRASERASDRRVVLDDEDPHVACRFAHRVEPTERRVAHGEVAVTIRRSRSAATSPRRTGRSTGVTARVGRWRARSFDEPSDDAVDDEAALAWVQWRRASRRGRAVIADGERRDRRGGGLRPAQRAIPQAGGHDRRAGALAACGLP